MKGAKGLPSNTCSICAKMWLARRVGLGRGAAQRCEHQPGLRLGKRFGEASAEGAATATAATTTAWPGRWPRPRAPRQRGLDPAEALGGFAATEIACRAQIGCRLGEASLPFASTATAIEGHCRARVEKDGPIAVGQRGLVLTQLVSGYVTINEGSSLVLLAVLMAPVQDLRAGNDGLPRGLVRSSTIRPIRIPLLGAGRHTEAERHDKAGHQYETPHDPLLPKSSDPFVDVRM